MRRKTEIRRQAPTDRWMSARWAAGRATNLLARFRSRPAPALPSSVRRVAPAGCRPSLASDRRGVAGVEFAMLALPTIALIGIIAESGVVVLAQHTLDVSVERAARLLRTGEFQDRSDGSDPTERLRRLMCGDSGLFFACRNVRLDVTRSDTFKGSQVAEPYDRQTRAIAQSFGTQFQCPAGDDVIAIRAAVPVLRLFAMLDFTGRRLGGSRQLLISTSIFRAEAYDSKPCQ